MTLKIIKNGKAAKGKSLQNSKDVYEVMRFLIKKDREHFYVLHLDARNRIIAKEIISIGTLTDTSISAREVFKGAILNNSAQIICIHNHPSGAIKPSQGDIEITDRLKKAGDIIGIPVLDHVVIGSEGYTSMKEYCVKEAAQVAEKSISEDKKQELLAAKEVAKEMGFNQTVRKWFEREDTPVSEKIIGLVYDSLSRLSIAKATLNDENLLELKDYKLSGIKNIIEDIFNLLDGAAELHARTH